ncbi:MAG: bifunctional precorrin-2 dehydrogenase/sirohydrochlorin ferrochelatase [Luteitalea sp.]|nr:bifunctional precorrin-2 dehydrogenase/sirohydrochlorin ferrochelatase [Luteitalea sp.]
MRTDPLGRARPRAGAETGAGSLTGGRSLPPSCSSDNGAQHGWTARWEGGCVSGEVPLFPVFLKLAGRPVLLVGGGSVAASKLDGLLQVGAEVTVVAPEIQSSLERPGVVLVRRGFEALDLDGKWFVVAAAPPEVNRAVAAAAETRGLFVNAVDDPPNAAAYLGGVLRRGDVTVAISTGGHAPALAGLVREGLDALLPRELDTWASLARAVRARWLAERVPMTARRPLLLDALNRLYEPVRVALR